MSSGKDRLLYKLPDVQSGYELDPERGYFSVIVPEATNNLVINPSAENADTTGYAAFGAGVAIASVSTWQAYGAYGIRITPSTNVESGVYYGTVPLTSGTTYTASIVIQGEVGKSYTIWFATTAGALLGTKRTWIGSGVKQRIHVTYTETSSTTRRIYITRNSYVDTNYFYVDGLQVEAKTYPTTYCDGDQIGLISDKLTVQPSYWWTGTPHASVSGRSVKTRAGGKEVSLLELGLRIYSVSGLGMSPLEDQFLPIPGFGEFPQGTGTSSREFILTGAIYSNNMDPRYLHSIRKALIDVVKPTATSLAQPMLLRYQAVDADGNPVSESLDIVCKYMDGLEGNWDNNQQERLALRFKMHSPFIQSTYVVGGLITSNSSFACSYIAQRSAAGTWSAVGAGLDNSPYCMAVGNNGILYLGGLFHNAGGGAALHVASYNPYTGTWSALAAGCADPVRCMAIAPNGDLYVGLAAGAGTTNKVQKWNGAAWSIVSAGGIGIAINGSVEDMVFLPNGDLVVVGGFTTIDAVAYNHIARWDGAAWNDMGAGTGGALADAVCVACSMNGDVYVGGFFTTMDGVTVNQITKWDGTVWTPLGTGLSYTGTEETVDVFVAPNGEVWIAGALDTVGGVAAKVLASWNGVSWKQISDGITYANNSFNFYKDYLDNIYLTGYFSYTGIGIRLPDGIARINGNIISGLDIDTDGSVIYSCALSTEGTFFIGGNFTNAVSSSINVSNLGGAYAYPVFQFTGPGNLWQLRNADSDVTISFSSLVLLPGEIAVLDLRPDSIRFYSNFRDNLMPYILKGSNLNFYFIEGNNNVSVYMSGTTASSKVIYYLRNLYWGLEGAVLE